MFWLAWPPPPPKLAGNIFDIAGCCPRNEPLPSWWPRPLYGWYPPLYGTTPLPLEKCDLPPRYDWAALPSLGKFFLLSKTVSCLPLKSVSSSPLDFLAASIVPNSINAWPRGYPLLLFVHIVTLLIPAIPSSQQSLKCSFSSSMVALYSTFLTHIDL